MADIITGSDTLTLYDRTFIDLADGDASMLEFPNDEVNIKTGKDGNSIFSRNEAGRNANLTLRLIKGSADDKFLQTKIADRKRDFVNAGFASGNIVKPFADAEGNFSQEVVTLNGGVISRSVDTKYNADGDTEQGVSIYRFKFARAERSFR